MAIAICGASPTLLGGQVCQLVLLSIEEIHVSFLGGVTNSAKLIDSQTQTRHRDVCTVRYRSTNLLANRWPFGCYDPCQEGIITPPCTTNDIQTHPLAHVLGFGTFPGDLLAN